MLGRNWRSRINICMTLFKNLADIAEYYAAQQSGSDWEVYVEPSANVFRKKFAELIVEDAYNLIVEESGKDNGLPS